MLLIPMEDRKLDKDSDLPLSAVSKSENHVYLGVWPLSEVT